MTQDAQKLLERSGLLEDPEKIYEHWDVFLNVLRFLLHKRFKNGNKEKNSKRELAGSNASTPNDSRNDDEKNTNSTKESAEEYNKIGSLEIKEKKKKKRKKKSKQVKEPHIRKVVSRASHDMDLDDATMELINSGNPLKLFKIGDQVGRGGFGTVFRSKRVDTKQVVAVKKLSHLTDKEKWNNLDEIYFLKSLIHPCIVPFNAAYMHRDEVWIIMEFLAGGSLSEVVKLDRFEEQHICYIVWRVCSVLYFEIFFSFS